MGPSTERIILIDEAIDWGGFAEELEFFMWLENFLVYNRGDSFGSASFYINKEVVQGKKHASMNILIGRRFPGTVNVIYLGDRRRNRLPSLEFLDKACAVVSHLIGNYGSAVRRDATGTARG